MNEKMKLKDRIQIYIKNNKNNENGFTLYENSLQENSIKIPVDDDFDMDIYVVGSKYGKFSKHSNIINVKK